MEAEQLMRQRWVVPLALALITLLGVSAGIPSGSAAHEMKTHSGTVVAIDIVRGVLVIDEVGPWRARSGVSRIRRTVLLMPGTDFLIAVRVNPHEGFPGSFVEGQMDPEAIEPGAMVTIECLHDGPRLIARTVTLVSTADP